MLPVAPTGAQQPLLQVAPEVQAAAQTSIWALPSTTQIAPAQQLP
jgi:hypothetical protein